MDVLRAPDRDALTARILAAPQVRPIPRTDEDDRLSIEQRTAWFASLARPDSTAYAFVALLAFDRHADVGVLSERLERLARRQPIVTATIVGTGPSARLELSGSLAGALRVVEAGPATSVRETLEAAGEPAPFALSTGPLLRWTLVRHSDGTSTLVHVEHHAIHDGMSFDVLMREIVDGGTDAVVRPYREHVTAQTGAAEGAMRAHSMLERMRASLSPAGAMHSADEPAVIPVRARCLRLPIPRDVELRARAMSRRLGVTPFVVWLDAFLRATEDARDGRAAGIAVSTRTAGFESTVGMFVQVVPLCLEDDRDAVDAQRIPALRDTVLESMEHRGYDPQEYVSAARDAGLAGSVWPCMVFSEFDRDARETMIGGLRAQVTPGAFNGETKFPLNVIRIVEGDVAELQLEYDPRRYDEDEVFGIYERCIAAWSEATPPPTPARLWSPRWGGTVAVRDDRDAFTYEDLELLSQRVSGAIGQDDVVGVLGGPSSRAFALQAAIHAAGGTFVPLDPRQGQERLVHAVATAGCSLIIAPDEERLDHLDAPHLAWSDLMRVEPVDLAARRPSSIAYIVLTSGTTGAPKGVAVGNASLAALVSWGAEALGLEQGTRVMQTASPGFDASIWEVWTAFGSGSTLHLASTWARRDAVLLRREIESAGAEVAFAPTPIAELLLELDWSGARLRVLGAGGGQLNLPGRRVPFEVLNLYGPSEATSVAVACGVETAVAGPAPIGRFLPYVDGYVVDEAGRLVESGAVGELWLTGAGIAEGYVGASAAESSRFITDPFHAAPRRAYRTGDLVRVDAAGDLRFVGRRDRQVKLGGVRIELSDLEAMVRRHPTVGRCVALGDDHDGQPQVIVAVEPRSKDLPVDAAGVTAALPPLFRSIVLVALDTLPLTSNGKVDERAVLASARHRVQHDASASDAPSTDAADAARLRAVLDAFSAAVPGVGHGRWFALGGSSLAAATFVHRCATELGVRMDLAALLEATDARGYVEDAARRGHGNGA